jgi:tetratricopeptide (TPR) repeat protein
MRWAHAERLLKGLFLGLLAYAALVVPTPEAAGTIAACMLGGLAVGLAVAAARERALRPAGRWLPYLLLLLLEHPPQIFGGVLTGLTVGIVATQPAGVDARLFPALVGAGLLLGAGLLAFRAVRRRPTRALVAAGVAAAVVAAGLWVLHERPEFDRRAVGLYLLLGLPFAFILSFAGETEETEAEVAAWCVAVALAVWLIKVTPGMPAVALAIPAAAYYVYTRRVMPGVRVFKHALRGLSYARLGRPRDALVSLRRAAELDPANDLARATLWEVHRRLAPADLRDPDLVGLVDPLLCLDRVAGLLTEPPGPAVAVEARHLLELVEHRAPRLAAPVAYWRAVADVHAHDLDAAAGRLAHVLDASRWPADDAARRSVLFAAWNLALILHPELRGRVGEPELRRPGRRLEAIDAVERVLADAPADDGAWALKRVLYAGLTEADFSSSPAGVFDPLYAEQLGLALVSDPGRARRGAEFLGFAARGLAAEAPRLWVRAAEALEAAGDPAGAARARQSAKGAGLAGDPKALPDESRHAFFAAVKRLAEDAVAAGDLDAAAGDLQLFTDYERSGVDTLKDLAELHTRRGDTLAALRTNEQALLYAPKDPELLERRGRYHFSVTPAQLRQAPEARRQAVNVDYCLSQARQVADRADADAERLDWARHLAELACVVRPRDFGPRVTAARVLLRLGERQRALQLLEDVREERPERFASAAEEDAWQFGSRLLGDLYLNDLDRPDLAVGCFLDYRRSNKSGADTLYKLARAYERLGQPAQAGRFYRQVAAYEGHPLAADADAALRRVGG